MQIFTLWFFRTIYIYAASLCAIVLTPCVCVFANRATGRLPNAFWWMETPTARLPGSRGFQRDNLERFGWYSTAVLWLWRNKAYALSDTMRVDPDFDNAKLHSRGNPRCNNDPYEPGWFFGKIAWTDGAGAARSAFEFRCIFPMPFNRCFMIRAGYKLSAWFDGRRPDKPTATGMFQAMSIRPFLSRK